LAQYSITQACIFKTFYVPTNQSIAQTRNPSTGFGLIKPVPGILGKNIEHP